MNPKITPEHLRRRAIVYVRQSTVIQVLNNRESQRRQYGLSGYAQELGFVDVMMIDDDLGRSGSGLVDRPGFQRLVAEVCAGQVGAVFCLEASRLARNGRDWHHLIELCGLVGTLVIDPEGVYDPCLINDRLLLGLKGTMSEFELHLLRQRSVEAMQQKARRGEFQCNLPIGYSWTPDGKVEIDPDRRIQQAIGLVFERFTVLGSARQVLMEFRSQGMLLPVRRHDVLGATVEWKPPVYATIHKILSNAVYAGAYAFGKTEARTAVVDGRAKKTVGHHKSRQDWTVLLRDHHPGYVSWEQYERNQRMLTENNFMRSGHGRKAGRGGNSLLTGLLRCRRCGRMLYTYYTGRGDLVRYLCRGAKITQGAEICISFAGLKPEQRVVEEILRAVQGPAIQAALQAAERAAAQQASRLQALNLELEQARYQAGLAEKRYEAVDPANRLVADELETRWNRTLRNVEELEKRLREEEAAVRAIPIPNEAALLRLANDLPSLWHAPTTDLRLKQRIIRILIEEIVVDVDRDANQVVLLIHWSGGSHSELRVTKPRTGEHGRRTAAEAVEIVKQMASRYSDEVIASVLNRLRLETGAGNTWKKHRVCSLRHYLGLPCFKPNEQPTSRGLTAEQAAERLGVSQQTVRELLREGVLEGAQVVKFAPWEIPAESLTSERVVKRLQGIRAGERFRRTGENGEHTLRLPGL
ncbi:MAG: recombinase family protein [Candidatus Korobacteraceae bacterium]